MGDPLADVIRWGISVQRVFPKFPRPRPQWPWKMVFLTALIISPEPEPTPPNHSLSPPKSTPCIACRGNGSQPLEAWIETRPLGGLLLLWDFDFYFFWGGAVGAPSKSPKRVVSLQNRPQNGLPTQKKEHTPKRERGGSNRTPPRLPPPTPPSLVGSVGSASLQRRCQAPPGESCGAQRSWGGSSGNLPDRSPGGLKPKDGKPKGKPTQLERKGGVLNQKEHPASKGAAC